MDPTDNPDGKAPPRLREGQVWDSGQNEAVARAISGSRGLSSNLSASGRVVSLVVAGGYLAAGAFTRDFDAFLTMLGFIILSLALIWLPDSMGAYQHGRINRPTAGAIARIGGFILLFAPIVAAIIGTVKQAGAR